MPALPIAILQGTFFNSKLPPAINYGAAGFISGHEMSHSIMDTFEESLHLIDAHECIEKHTTSLVEPQTGIRYRDADYFLPETVADVGSTNATLIAFRNDKGSNIRLPGEMSKFTPEQLFFIKSATNWCHHSTDKFINDFMTGFDPYGDVDPHPFNYHRVMIPFMSSPDFSGAFNCKLGSKMSPVKKCRLW